MAHDEAEGIVGEGVGWLALEGCLAGHCGTK